MDPISAITTAIATGAAAAISPTEKQAVQDLYAGVKKMKLKHFEHYDAYRFLLKFENGTVKETDLAELIGHHVTLDALNITLPSNFEQTGFIIM